MTNRPSRPLALLALALLLAVPSRAADPPATVRTPEETVRRYLTAVQRQDFDEAWDLVSTGMKRGKSKDVWVREQQYIYAFAEVKIFDFEVYPGKIVGAEAIVPNLLSSQDKFLNQLALDENELYTLVKEEGVWKVDRQKIAEGAELAEFFPKERGPAAGATPAAAGGSVD